MKKVLFFLVIGCIISCKSNTESKNESISNEEKILELIKDDMFKTLYDFESYEPIETSKIDSAYTTIYQDSIIREEAVKIIATMEICDKILNECEEHYRTIEIWGDSYTVRARNKVNEAREELSKNLTYAEKALAMVKDAQKTIKKESENFAPNFIGWSVTHKFRCKTKGGAYDLGEYKYIFSPQLDKILYTIDLESEIDEKISSIIDEVLKQEED
jgi:hypothetical protein